MRPVDVKYHVVKNATANLPFPADELKLLFRTTGIDLSLVEGERIDNDPTYNPFLAYVDLVQLYDKKDRHYGHLIIGLDGPDYRFDIAGQLLDLDWRGVAVVYTCADYIQRDGEGAFLQTCAHEIGHMLNLGHNDVASDFVSAMNQAQNRELDTSRSWQDVKAEAEVVKSQGKPDYFFPPEKELNCYPFAYQARYNLNIYSPDRLLPWGGKFERPYDGVNIAWNCHNRPHLDPERNRSRVEHREVFHS